MASFFVAELLGRIGQRPQRREDYIGFSVAYNYTVKDKQETLWVSCYYSGERTKVFELLQSGTEVFVRGRVAVKTYRTRNGDIKPSVTLSVTELKILHQPLQEESPSDTETGLVVQNAAPVDFLRDFNE